MGLFSKKPKPGPSGGTYSPKAPTRKKAGPNDVVASCRRCKGPILRCEQDMTARLGGCPGCSLT
jgi:hypothetical protein